MWELGLPLLLLLILGGLGIVLQRACKFKTPEDPYWPYAENPGLALELADSPEFVNKVLGEEVGEPGEGNRKAAKRFQYLDFVFIVFYVLFLSSVPLVTNTPGWFVVVGLALLTALFDVIENIRILHILRPKPGGPVKFFGQTKWFFYFATVAAEGALLFFNHAISSVRIAAGILLGLALIGISIGGITSSIKGTFNGISSATRLSGIGLLALALFPPLANWQHEYRDIAYYAVLMRVPLVLGVLLFALPFIAFLSGAKTLLRGLFDLTPLSLFVVTVTSLAVSGTACVTASIILNNAPARFLDLAAVLPPKPSASWWLGLTVFLSLPVITFSVGFSASQKHGLRRLVFAALLATALMLLVSWILIENGSKYAGALPWLSSPELESYLTETTLFDGYVGTQGGKFRDPWPDHLFALAAFAFSFFLYALVGFYGRCQLGKQRTVPALCSLLMLMLMIGWMLSALTFFFDLWRVPTLIIVALVGTLTAQSRRSDHFYNLQKRIGSATDPTKTLTASHQNRVIVVAANGGGIQAGAWTAQVLFGLCEDNPDKFKASLRMISSVSGGSVGNIFFVNWLANEKVARQPDEAAVMSSLDEVAWGLAWPDFLRALFPWVFGRFIGRGRALERAWVLNSRAQLNVPDKIDDPLSNWNELVSAGKIPGVALNATISETGERLLLATTRLSSRFSGGALVDATELHTINGESFDVRAVTAARLSATFPYVTPASRSDGPGPQPHVVDGGYYDNYGMATLVEWLDEALSGAGEDEEIKSVLVIQIYGAPVNSDRADERHAKSRGWFYQAFAPIATLLSVRSAGQIAHNVLELKFLQQKWAEAGVPIHSVIFEFNNPNAPLSWHLTPREVEDIRSVWRDDMAKCRTVVSEFLAGNERLECGCIKCSSPVMPS